MCSWLSGDVLIIIIYRIHTRRCCDEMCKCVNVNSCTVQIGCSLCMEVQPTGTWRHCSLTRNMLSCRWCWIETKHWFVELSVWPASPSVSFSLLNIISSLDSEHCEHSVDCPVNWYLWPFTAKWVKHSFNSFCTRGTKTVERMHLDSLCGGGSRDTVQQENGSDSC